MRFYRLTNKISITQAKLQSYRCCKTIKELDADSRQTIKDNHRWVNEVTGNDYPCPHIFKNMLDLLPPGAFNECDGFVQKRVDVFRAPFILVQACDSCRQQCMVPMDDIDLDCSGLPCTDNSRAKKNILFYEGPTGVLFILWALRIRRSPKLKMSILENTPDTWFVFSRCLETRIDCICLFLDNKYQTTNFCITQHSTIQNLLRQRIWYLQLLNSFWAISWIFSSYS